MGLTPKDKELLQRLRDDPELLEALIQSIQQSTLTPDGDVHPFYSFVPLPKQREALSSTKRIVCMACANQVGKSTTGSVWIDMRLAGFNPMNPAQKFPQNGRYWACTKGDLIDGLVDKVLMWLPPSEIEIVRRAPGRQFIGMKNGNQCKFKSYDQPRSAFQQESLHGLWNDEEMPREIWQEQQTRLIRFGGQTLLTFTPVEGSVWLHELLFDERNRGWIDVIQMAMRDNTYLPIEHVEDYIRNFLDDPDQFAIRIEGDYRLMVGSKVFEQEQIEAMWKRTVEPIRRINFTDQGEVREADERDPAAWEIWEEPVPTLNYSLGGDVSLGGIKGDYSAGVILNSERTRVVALCRRKCDPYEWGFQLGHAGYYYNTAIQVPEQNGPGVATVTALQHMEYPRIYRRESYTGAPRRQTSNVGFITTKSSKPTLVSQFQSLFNSGMIDIRQAKILDEARRYVWYRVEIPGSFGCGAATGNDDLLVATMLANEGLKQVRRRNDEYGQSYDESMVNRLERGAAEARDDSDANEGWD